MTDAPSALGALMRSEINEQPEMFERILSSAPTEIEQVAAAIRAYQPTSVLLVARGTSEHAAIHAKYLIETDLGLPVGLVSMSSYTTYGASPALKGVLWIALSQSGGSPDLSAATKVARANGALTVAFTNNPESLLASTADHHVYLQAGPELAVAATKSYTATILATTRLVLALKGEKDLDLAPLPQLAQAALETSVEEVANRYRTITRLVTVSRGYAYATARESALKIMETNSIPAQAFSGADLQHGPMAMVQPTTPVLMIVPEGKATVALQPVIDAITAKGAELSVVGAKRLPEAEAFIELPAGIDERLAPIVQILPLQRLALEMSTRRGINPDAPVGLKKVTETL